MVGSSSAYQREYPPTIPVAPAETGERSFGGGNGASRILLVSQRNAGDHLTVGRLDNFHELAAVGLNKFSIYVVRRDCRHRVSLVRSEPSAEVMDAENSRLLHVSARSQRMRVEVETSMR